MIVIGVVFLVLAALAVIGAVVTGRDVNVHLSGFGVDSTTTVLWVFCAGAATMLFLALSWSSFRRAARRARMRRRELKQLRAEEAEAGAHRDVDMRDRELMDDTRTASVVPADDGRERRYVAGDDQY